MNHRMIKELAEGLKPAISEAFKNAVKPLLVRLSAVEARTPENGEKGETGERGVDGLQGETGPVGPAGERGEKGERGEPGEPGSQGEPGAIGINGKDADPILIERMVGDVVAKIQPAKDGRDGQPGIPGRDGKDGADGMDGLGFEDITEDYEDDGRVLVRRFSRGGTIIKEFRHTTSSMIDRGVWRAGNYSKGDSVSFRGSLFIAQEDTSDEPETSKAWRLAVKRGRDGKDGVMRPALELKPVALK